MQSDQTSYEDGLVNAALDDYNEIVHAPQRFTTRRHLGDKTFGVGAKRAVDLLLSLLIAAVFLPLIIFCCVALAISNGPIVFSQQRVGKGAQLFRVYKFRTMVPNAPQVLKQLLANDAALRAEYERDHKLKNDPRITRVGKFLRRTSLDELPQLLNVVRGEMSLVGPRPVEPFEMAKYGVHARYYYAQRPGLTGIWQISGRSNVSYEQRVAMDTYYSRKRTLWMDLRIIVATAVVVLTGHGAH